MMNLEENYSMKQYLQEIIQNKVGIFDELTRWSEQETKEFSQLLNELKKPFNKAIETTKEKGDRLERLVEFIIKKTYFYDIYNNVRTETNEIDEIIVLSKQGKQALITYGLSRDLLPIDSEIFLGECKNYVTSLSVTYVGKFYSLLRSTDIQFGIIFTQNGLSGNSEGFKDAYGLAKVLRLVEKYENNKELYIITFTLDDYQLLLEGKTFFEIVKSKMLEMQIASNYKNFLINTEHENTDTIKELIKKTSLEIV